MIPIPSGNALHFRNCPYCNAPLTLCKKNEKGTITTRFKCTKCNYTKTVIQFEKATTSMTAVTLFGK